MNWEKKIGEKIIELRPLPEDISKYAFKVWQRFIVININKEYWSISHILKSKWASEPDEKFAQTSLEHDLTWNWNKPKFELGLTQMQYDGFHNALILGPISFYWYGLSEWKRQRWGWVE